MPATSLFLALPAELRNQIYREALVTDMPLSIDAQQPTSIVEPALMRINRQVRRETLPIYYGENPFYLMVHDLNARVLLPFTRRLITYRLPTERLFNRTTLFLTGTMTTWNSLKAWLQILHGGEAIPYPEDVGMSTLPVGDPMRVVLQAEEMMARLYYDEWEKVEDALEILRTVAAGYDQAWAA